MEKLAVRNGEIPVVYCSRRYVLRNPSIAKLATFLDLNINIDKGVRDVLKSDRCGLSRAPRSSVRRLRRTEDADYRRNPHPVVRQGREPKDRKLSGLPKWGFPGQELANRSIAQAQTFGAQLMVAQSVVHIDCSRQPYRIVLESGLKFNARSVLIATGARMRDLPVEEAGSFYGQRGLLQRDVCWRRSSVTRKSSSGGVAETLQDKRPFSRLEDIEGCIS